MSYIERREGWGESGVSESATFDWEHSAFAYVFKWYAMGDACDQCGVLNGRVWYEQDIFQRRLWDSIWGDIYDLDLEKPLTHGGSGINCRCYLDVEADVNIFEMTELEEFQKFLEMMI